MANTYIIRRTRVVVVHETLRTRADSVEDALYCVQENEFEVDDSEEIDELEEGEISGGSEIHDVEEVKDDY